MRKSSRKIRRRSFVKSVGGASVLLSVATAGCLGSSSDSGNKVEMTDELNFEPKTVTIDAGEKVTWENVGTIGHTVTAYEDQIPEDAEYFASGGFDTVEEARNNLDEGIIEGGETYEHTFETTGEYGYFCIPHESSMRGTVVVE